MKNIYIKFIAFCSILLCTIVIKAQEPGTQNTGNNLETTDVPVSKINDYTIPMLIFGGLLSIYLIDRKIKAKD